MVPTPQQLQDISWITAPWSAPTDATRTLPVMPHGRQPTRSGDSAGSGSLHHQPPHFTWRNGDWLGRSPSVSHFGSAFHPYLNLATALWIIDFLVHCLNQEIARKKKNHFMWAQNWMLCASHWTKCFFNSKWSILFSELFLPHFFKLWSLNPVLKWCLKKNPPTPLSPLFWIYQKENFGLLSFQIIFCNLLALFVCLRGRFKRANCQNESSHLAENDNFN